MTKIWSEVSDSNFWKPEKENEEIEGVVISKETGDYGLKVILETSPNNFITLPSHKVLQSRLQQVAIGDKIKVVFLKKELPKIKGHQPTNIYKILIEKEE
jgi:hypothetical protein